MQCKIDQMYTVCVSISPAACARRIRWTWPPSSQMPSGEGARRVQELYVEGVVYVQAALWCIEYTSVCLALQWFVRWMLLRALSELGYTNRCDSRVTRQRVFSTSVSCALLLKIIALWYAICWSKTPHSGTVLVCMLPKSVHSGVRIFDFVQSVASPLRTCRQSPLR